jgi:hypothetical protein
MSKKPGARQQAELPLPVVAKGDYDQLLYGVSRLLDEARRTAARSVNVLLTATYWEIGR